MPAFSPDQIAFDRDHLWHPYTSLTAPLPTYPVVSANGVRLQLADGREVIDGMASWWCVIHGYNHPVLNQAAREQLEQMAHVMFGGLTHAPAIALGQTLTAITAEPLQHVFFSDSGSVAVEVAMKMALQYWHGLGKPQRQRFLTIRGGYHGDTLGAMSVCDPVSGMHQLFQGVLPQQLFAPRPQIRPEQEWDAAEIAPLAALLAQHHDSIAAIILEPVVQGAGGMHFYHPAYLREARALCDRYGLLLILDEIATGFGRTGKLFAYEHADITPDILCVGKALTGGYLSLAATLVTDAVARGVNAAGRVFMHGPTFMANPLACAIANASIRLLLESPWQERVATMARHFQTALEPLRQHPAVADVRSLGAIGVIELHQPLDVAKTQAALIAHGVWLRQFGKLLYAMPPFVMTTAELQQVTDAMRAVVEQLA